jgi:hypothetical protein
MSKRFAIAFLVGASAGAAFTAMFFGPASPATIVVLLGVLIGLRLMARSLKRAA